MVEVSLRLLYFCLFMPCTAETLFTFMLLLDYSSLKVESEISTASEEKQRGHVDIESVILIFPDLREGQ